MKLNQRILFLLVLAFVVAMPEDSSAQILKGLGRKIEKKLENETNRRVERRIDRTIDKGFDKVEQSAEDAVKGDGGKSTTEKPSSSKTGNESESAVSTLSRGNTSTNVTLLDVYDFDFGISYAIQSGNNEARTTMWFGKSDYFGMTADVGHDMFMVLHDGSMIGFMQNQKTYMVMGGGMVEGLVGAAAEEASSDAKGLEFTINKVGTDRILGYNCDIYEMKSADYSSKVWLTKEAGLEPTNFMGAFSTLVKNSAPLPQTMSDVGGLMLKMEGQSTNDNETVILEATGIHKENRKINTSDYRSIGF